MCLSELQLTWCIIYLDGIMFLPRPLGAPAMVVGHLSKTKKAKPKLKPNKCEFFYTEIAFLGHVVSREGVRTDEQKTKAVHDWPKPNTVTEVCNLIGLPTTIGDSSGPMQKLLTCYISLFWVTMQIKEISGCNKIEACQTTLMKIKDLCCLAPVLAFANFSKPFTLHMDVRGIGLGAVLYQELEAKE